MGSLSAWFETLLFGTGREGQKTVVTVIGSGGKTSLIWRLAASLRPGRKILVTPTTKIFVPPEGSKLYDGYYNGVPRAAAPGITLAGLFNEASGKLESLPLQDLEGIIPYYDLVLIEGDGSRELPLKAWTKDEPVVPASTAFTIGVLPLWPLGKPVSEKLIHRLPLFLTLSGAAQGESLKPEHFLRLITGVSKGTGALPLPGLFAKARGRKVLFFNQIEDDEALRQARELVDLLPPEFRGGLTAIIAGSVQKNIIEEL